jgi:hypothetical protein
MELLALDEHRTFQVRPNEDELLNDVAAAIIVASDYKASISHINRNPDYIVGRLPLSQNPATILDAAMKTLDEWKAR